MTKQVHQKIVIIGPAHPLRGGLAAFSERLARAFKEEGDEVVLVSFSLQYPNFLFPGKTQYSSDPAPKDLEIHSLINSVNPFTWWSAAQQIRKMRPDLVICTFWLPFMGPCLGTIMRLIRRDQQIQRVALVHNMIPHEHRPGDRMLSKYFVGPIAAFMALSDSVKKDIHQFCPNKPVKVVPHPIYDHYGDIHPQKEARKQLSLSDDAQYLLFFGFIREYKGLDLLLHAMADKRIRQSPVRLIIAGEFYANEDYYQRLIEELGIASQLILKTSYIPSEQVPYYFCAANLVVQPYKTATQSGISQLALFFEKPMVVTRVGGLPELVDHGHSGYVVDLKPKAIADAIIDFFDHSREPAMSNAQKQLKQQYSWEKMTEGIRGLLKKDPPNFKST